MSEVERDREAIGTLARLCVNHALRASTTSSSVDADVDAASEDKELEEHASTSSSSVDADAHAAVEKEELEEEELDEEQLDIILNWVAVD